MAASRRHRKWTYEEDMVLRYEAEAQRDAGAPINWTAISEKLPGRNNKDCRKRWLKTVEVYRKGPWTTDEDERLLAAMDTHGTRWNRVAQHVGTRNADQCAKHWQHSLDPNIDRSPWTASEDEELLKAVSELGRSWRLITSTRFPSRSPTDLKNRYELMCRRRQDGPLGATPPSEPMEVLGNTTTTISHPTIQTQSLAQAQFQELCPPEDISGSLANLHHQGFDDWLHPPPADCNMGPGTACDPPSTAPGADSWMTSLALDSAECSALLADRPSSHATPSAAAGDPSMSSQTIQTPFPQDGTGFEDRKSLTSYTLVLENVDSTEIGDVLSSLMERGLMLNMRLHRQTA